MQSVIQSTVIQSTKSEPYLWVHLAGIAAAPIFLELCLLGLKAAEMGLPAGLVFLLVAVIGIGPVVWMQWQRPFNIFSLVFLALKPNELSETQRRILTRFKAPLGKIIAVSVAVVALILLWQLNQWVPLVVIKAKLVPGGSLGGLLLAAAAFLLSNLFLQVPASVLPVILTSDRLLAATDPYPVKDIARDFTLIGFRVKQILPSIQASPDVEKTKAIAAADSDAAGEVEAIETIEAVQPAAEPSVSESAPPTVTRSEPTFDTQPVSQPTEQLTEIEPLLQEDQPEPAEQLSEPLSESSSEPSSELLPEPPEQASEPSSELTQPESVQAELLQAATAELAQPESAQPEPDEATVLGPEESEPPSATNSFEELAETEPLKDPQPIASSPESAASQAVADQDAEQMVPEQPQMLEPLPPTSLPTDQTAEQPKQPQPEEPPQPQAELQTSPQSPDITAADCSDCRTVSPSDLTPTQPSVTDTTVTIITGQASISAPTDSTPTEPPTPIPPVEVDPTQERNAADTVVRIEPPPS